MIYVLGSYSASSSSLRYEENVSIPPEIQEIHISEFQPTNICKASIETEVTTNTGQDLFNKNCRNCHDLVPQLTVSFESRQVNLTPLPIDQAVQVINYGQGHMPVYGHILSDQEIEILYLYLKDILKEHLFTLKQEIY
ncbi:c-type cytochrome [Desulfuribacillus stibiiarsenatis]|uniref:c-type cytochrome n=1 Tax=Desulfuribacillus stibiiarsenatis TaxID=1390249 RepID=UPI00159EFA71|nr:cytochrome c [Desulfuribacillus stibiiarsenatis]